MASQAQPLAQTEPAQPTPQVPAFGFSLIAGRHKSLVPPLTWQCIPPLAILSGMNGSGKTQLMQAIAMQYDENVRRRGRHSDVELRFDEHKYAPHDVFYLEQFDSFFNNDVISLSNYNETIDNLRSNNSSDVFQKMIAKKARQLPPDQFPFEDLYADLHRVDRAIVHDFLDYLIKDSNLARASKDRSVLGEPPWDAINRILQQSSFPYQLVAPEEINLLKPLRLELRGSDVEDAISLRDLSSGELSLVRFLLFAFAANRMARGPKLLLLDEPDAHLHCSLIQPFLIGIQNILIEEFGFRVIMTTHRTETLALAPEGSLYEMHRTGERIRKSESKTRTISMLTGSIVGIVYGGRRMVVVEDVADVAFYRSVFGTLRRSADWRPAIEPEFLSASWLVEVRRIRHAELRRVAADRQGPKGGKGNVRLVVNEFNSLGLTDVVAGLIDRDAALNAYNRGSTMALPNVFTLERYSIENYLLDPLYVYVYLLHHGRKINVARELSIGEEPYLVKWNNEELQRIADLVGDGLKQNLTVRPSESELTQVDVLYTNGKHIKLPAWLLRRRGKDLRVAAAAFATPIIFKNEELEVAMQRIGFVPVELRDTLEAALGYRASAQTRSDDSPWRGSGRRV